MRTPKKSIEDIPNPPEEELLERIKQMKEPYKSFAAFTYLFGNRVSEPLKGTIKQQIGSYEYTHPRTKKTSKQPIYKDTQETRYEPLTKWRIKEMGDGWVECDRIPTLKRRDEKHFYREGYVYVLGKGELPFWIIIKKYLATKKHDEPLWTFNRVTAWRKIKEGTGVPPHKLRGLRATKDAVQYNMDSIELKEKYNWASTDMAFHYAKKNKRDIKAKIMANQEKT